MRNRILAIAAIAGAMAAPIAAQAQSTSHHRRRRRRHRGHRRRRRHRGRPAAGVPRIYRARTRAELHDSDRVVVGGVLPETGVTYYDVPQRFGATPYRYTVVNGQTVLVEPRSRRIVQVVE